MPCQAMSINTKRCGQVIRISIVPDGLIAQGHANHSKAGTDIVCAAVSILLQTLELRGTATKDKGDMIVHTEDREALRLVVEGLRLVAENYPENVEVIE